MGAAVGETSDQRGGVDVVERELHHARRGARTPGPYLAVGAVVRRRWTRSGAAHDRRYEQAHDGTTSSSTMQASPIGAATRFERTMST